MTVCGGIYDGFLPFYNSVAQGYRFCRDITGYGRIDNDSHRCRDSGAETECISRQTGQEAEDFRHRQHGDAPVDGRQSAAEIFAVGFLCRPEKNRSASEKPLVQAVYSAGWNQRFASFSMRSGTCSCKSIPTGYSCMSSARYAPLCEREKYSGVEKLSDTA